MSLFDTLLGELPSSPPTLEGMLESVQCWLMCSCGWLGLEAELAAQQAAHEFALLKTKWSAQERAAALFLIGLLATLVARTLAAIIALCSSGCRWLRKGKATVPSAAAPTATFAADADAEEEVEAEEEEEGVSSGPSFTFAPVPVVVLSDSLTHDPPPPSPGRITIPTRTPKLSKSARRAMYVTMNPTPAGAPVPAASPAAATAVAPDVPASGTNTTATTDGVEGEPAGQPKEAGEPGSPPVDAQEIIAARDTAAELLRQQHDAQLKASTDLQEATAARLEALQQQIDAQLANATKVDASAAAQLANLAAVNEQLRSQLALAKTAEADAKRAATESAQTTYEQTHQLKHALDGNASLSASLDSIRLEQKRADLEHLKLLAAATAANKELQARVDANTEERTRLTAQQAQAQTNAHRDALEKTTGAALLAQERADQAEKSVQQLQAALDEARATAAASIVQLEAERQKTASAETGHQTMLATQLSTAAELVTLRSTIQQQTQQLDDQRNELDTAREQHAAVASQLEAARADQAQARTQAPDLSQPLEAADDKQLELVLARFTEAETALSQSTDALRAMHERTKALEARIRELEAEVATRAEVAQKAPQSPDVLELNFESKMDISQQQQHHQPQSTTSPAASPAASPTLGAMNSSAPGRRRSSLLVPPSSIESLAGGHSIHPNVRSRKSSMVLAAGPTKDGPTQELKNVWNKHHIKDAAEQAQLQQQAELRTVHKLIGRLDRLLAGEEEDEHDVDLDTAPTSPAALVDTDSTATPSTATARTSMSVQLSKLGQLYRTVSHRLRTAQSQSPQVSAATTAADSTFDDGLCSPAGSSAAADLRRLHIENAQLREQLESLRARLGDAASPPSASPPPTFTSTPAVPTATATVVPARQPTSRPPSRPSSRPPSRIQAPTDFR